MASAAWSIEKRASFKTESPVGDDDNVPDTGCLSIIVLGASGDLAKKKTFPALFNLYRQVWRFFFPLFFFVMDSLLHLLVNMVW